MADCRWPFLVVIPIAFAIIVGFGWTVDDKVEDEIGRLWIKDSGSYAQDQNYADLLGVDVAESAFAAMAVSRVGKNILTANRLEEIRARMEQAESTTVRFWFRCCVLCIFLLTSHKTYSRTSFPSCEMSQFEHNGVTYTWDDFCSENPSPYQFPCLRLSAMDLYQEAGWTFTEMDRVEYYRNGIQELLIKPRLPRFGIMRSDCTEPCAFVLASCAASIARNSFMICKFLK